MHLGSQRNLFITSDNFSNYNKIVCLRSFEAESSRECFPEMPSLFQRVECSACFRYASNIPLAIPNSIYLTLARYTELLARLIRLRLSQEWSSNTSKISEGLDLKRPCIFLSSYLRPQFLLLAVPRYWTSFEHKQVVPERSFIPSLLNKVTPFLQLYIALHNSNCQIAQDAATKECRGM